MISEKQEIRPTAIKKGAPNPRGDLGTTRHRLKKTQSKWEPGGATTGKKKVKGQEVVVMVTSSREKTFAVHFFSRKKNASAKKLPWHSDRN